MRLRRVFIGFVSAVLLAAGIFTGTAYAVDTFTLDNITVSNIRVNPSSLPGSGQVAVDINISVDSSRAEGGITNVRVEGQGVASNTVDSISIGENKDLHFTLGVDASQLGQAIPLKLMWEGSPADGLPFTVTVASAAPAEPQVTFTRTVDKASVHKGDTVTLVYNVENTGTVDITGLKVTDEGIPDMPPLTKSSLKAGSSAALTYTYTPEADFTSKPKLAYTAGGKSYTAACDAKTVPLKVVQLDAVLEATPSKVNPGDEVTLLCTLTNSGSEKLTNITMSDKTLGDRLFPAATLDKGASRQFSRKLTLTQTTTFQYEITAKDETGNEVTFRSNELKVTVAAPAAKYDLEITAEPDALQLSEPGKVNFSITVTNKGDGSVSNVSIVDQEGNPIQSYRSLPAGATSFTYSREIDDTTTFNFTLVVPGEEGDYKVSTGPMEIKVAEPTATPAVTEQATPQASPEATDASQTASGSAASPSKMNILLTALLIVGLLIIITAFVLVWMIVADKKKRAKR